MEFIHCISFVAIATFSFSPETVAQLSLANLLPLFFFVDWTFDRNGDIVTPNGESFTMMLMMFFLCSGNACSGCCSNCR